MNAAKRAPHSPPDTRGEKVVERIRVEPQSLAAINDELHRQGVRTLSGLGSDEEGGWKFLRMMGFAALNRWFGIAQFMVRLPTGAVGEYNTKISQHSATKKGCCAVITFRDTVFITSEYRPLLLFQGKNPWCNELPRCCPLRGTVTSIMERVVQNQLFDLKSDEDREILESLLAQELAPIFRIPGVRIVDIQRLDNPAEDTGVSAEDFDIFHIVIETNDPSLLDTVRGTSTVRIRRVPLEDIVTGQTHSREGRLIPLHLEGAHTHSALYNLFRHLGWIHPPRKEG